MLAATIAKGRDLCFVPGLLVHSSVGPVLERDTIGRSGSYIYTGSGGFPRTCEKVLYLKPPQSWNPSSGEVENDGRHRIEGDTWNGMASDGDLDASWTAIAETRSAIGVELSRSKLQKCGRGRKRAKNGTGEELWIAGVGPRPQEWPGGYPGDLGEVLARGRSC
ncbi:hypothetical protein WN48_10692 [Eufriesea mexicana]|uniref:Uncharacterized protein n=1 Tax=Eufriesea mexicana TaxID=516756 RepID=A0A310SMM5_9HYME|nr:hypothetical protein WN48_10692 [Eufriesea mexicana]